MERNMDIYGTVISGFQPLLIRDIFYPEAYAVGLEYNRLSVLYQNVPTNKLICGMFYPEAYAVRLKYNGLSVLHQNVPTNKLICGMFYPEAYAVGLEYNGLSVLHQNVPTKKLNCNTKHKVRVEDPYYFSPMRSETERRVKNRHT